MSSVAMSAERITPEHIDARIKEVRYIKGPHTVTVCLVKMANDYVVVGHSACVDPAQYNEQVGREMAYQHAREQLWALEGYLLAERRRGAQ
jgi:hypothetical protein